MDKISNITLLLYVILITHGIYELIKNRLKIKLITEYHSIFKSIFMISEGIILIQISLTN